MAAVKTQSETDSGSHSVHRALRVARRARQASAQAATAGRLREAYAQIERLEAQLKQARVEASIVEDPAVHARLRVAAPALSSLCKGQPVDGTARLKRNVAWHSEVLPGPSASLAEWRAAQRGPRLDTGIPGVRLPEPRLPLA